MPEFPKPHTKSRRSRAARLGWYIRKNPELTREQATKTFELNEAFLSAIKRYMYTEFISPNVFPVLEPIPSSGELALRPDIKWERK